MSIFSPGSQSLQTPTHQLYTSSQIVPARKTHHIASRLTDDIDVPRPALKHDHFSFSLEIDLNTNFTALEEAYGSVMHTFHLDNSLLFHKLSARTYSYTDRKHAKLSKDLCFLDLSLYYFHPPHGFVFIDQNNALGYYCLSCKQTLRVS